MTTFKITTTDKRTGRVIEKTATWFNLDQEMQIIDYISIQGGRGMIWLDDMSDIKIEMI